MTLFRYSAYGLVFSCDQAIPSLEPIDGEAIADFEILTRPVVMPPKTSSLDEMEVAVENGDVYMRIAESGRYRISSGRSIWIDPDPGIPFDQVTIYLLGSVFGVILYQRDFLPMHCNAIEYDGRAFLFCGDSGAGKSTLAAYFMDKGHRLLTDDVCPLHVSANGVIASPGIARLKLWQNSLDLLGRSSEGLTQLPWRVDKYEIGLSHESQPMPLPVAALYHLREAGPDRRHGIHRISGLQAANTITANIYRRRVADLMSLSAGYLSKAVTLVTKVPVYSMNRQWGLEHFAAEAEEAIRHVKSI